MTGRLPIAQQRSGIILIVDDTASSIRVLHEAVRNLGEVYFATNGYDAMQMAHTHKPDVILLDIEMPGRDGFAVCEDIKADPQLADTAIIFITSHDEESHEFNALTQGGVDYIRKPINVPIARARIQTHLNLQIRTQALTQARRDLTDLMENLPAFIARWDTDLRNVFSNDIEGRWFNLPAKFMMDRALGDILSPEDFETIQPHIAAVLSGKSSTFDMKFMRSPTAMVYGLVSLVYQQEEEQPAGFLMLITNVTDRKLAEIALYDEKERIRVTLNSIGDAVIATDPLGVITFINPIAEDMTGWMASEAIGKRVEEIMPLCDGSMGHPLQNPIHVALKEKRIVGMAINCKLQRRDGRQFVVEDSAAPIRNHLGEITGAIIVFHDVSEARAMAIKMTHLANYDPLTNLPNRLLLQDRIEQALKQAQHNNERLAIILLDLDHFKNINDSMGHSIGDQLLKEVARRLSEAVRAGDTISRQGGDEFIILMPDISNIQEVSLYAHKLLEIVSHPYWIGTDRFDLTVSIGISLYPDDSETMEVLYRHADAAMYRAKQDGRNRCQFFSAEIERNLSARHQFERRLRDAMDLGRMEVFYQPKIDVRNQCIVGAEALVRWRDQQGQLISPADFIPIAEETGLIVQLGRFVLQQACMDAHAWHESGYNIPIAVNISPVQFNDASFINMVRSTLHESGIAHGQVELEITEGILANRDQALITMHELKKLGIHFAVDDFGTGYSSLSYLKQFPIDVLKIDQSFVHDMLNSERDAAIVSAIIKMAQGLGLQLVAEGVETRAQATALLELQCRTMQGYLYSRPIPLPEILKLFNQWKSRPSGQLDV